MTILALGWLLLSAQVSVQTTPAGPSRIVFAKPCSSVLARGSIQNTALATSEDLVWGEGVLVILVDEGRQGGVDLDGDGRVDGDVLHVFDTARGRVTNLATQSQGVVASDDVVVFTERDTYLHFLRHSKTVRIGLSLDRFCGLHLQAGKLIGVSREVPRDLNGDGDKNDSVPQYLLVDDFEPPLGAPVPHGPLPTPSGLAKSPGSQRFVLTPAGVFVLVWESGQGGLDRNGDGDADDQVATLVDPVTGAEDNFGLAVLTPIAATPELIVLPVYERSQGMTDLNGDGDYFDRVVHIYDTETKTSLNLGLCPGNVALIGGAVQAQGPWATFSVFEAPQGATDLNGDGDAIDQVLHVYKRGDPAAQNLGFAILNLAGVGERLLFVVEERAQGMTDLNSDGDTADQILFQHDLTTGASTNLGVQIILPDLEAGGSLVSLPVSEVASASDLNADGDLSDIVLVLYDDVIGGFVNTGLALDGSVFGLSSDLDLSDDHVTVNVLESSGNDDLNGDGDLNDEVVFYYKAGTATVVNTGLAGRSWLGEKHLAVSVLESEQGAQDLNGDGDALDPVVHILDLP